MTHLPHEFDFIHTQSGTAYHAVLDHGVFEISWRSFDGDHDRDYEIEVVESFIDDGTWTIIRGQELQFQLTPVEQEEPVIVRHKYMREISPGVWIDVYDVLYAFKVTDPCLQHLIKKALAAGQRGHKDERQDLVDIRDSAQRALDSHDVWSVK